MLRLLAIRNFAVIEALEIEFGGGFSVLTGETGAGKSILLDALSLLLGDRFEARQMRPGADRAEVAADFDITELPIMRAWLTEHDLAAPDDTLLVRRVLDAQGRTRSYINGHQVTLAQLGEAGAHLVDLNGQHAHQSLGRPEVQRKLLDAFGGFESLSDETQRAWRAWRDAVEQRERSLRDAQSTDAERELLTARQSDLQALGTSIEEWATLSQVQSRLAHAATLLQTASAGEAELAEGDMALSARLAALAHRLQQAAAHDSALDEIATLADEAKIRVDEAARALRVYRERLDLDPAQLAKVEARLSVIHDAARKYRVQPEELAALAAETEARLLLLAASADVESLARGEALALADFHAVAEQLSAKRKLAAAELGHRVTASLKHLAMTGARLEIALTAVSEPASFGLENVEFRVATQPKQTPGPLARIASGGELSRLSLAIQVVLAEVGEVPTLIFDEVDAGIGGAVAATVGQLLAGLGKARQVLCVTHLPQVAACADHHYVVSKERSGDAVSTGLTHLNASARIEEIARMLGGREITTKTRAHAKELLAQHRPAPAA
jgi:DNA repair protein RecN (Recombination protein N)